MRVRTTVSWPSPSSICSALGGSAGPSPSRWWLHRGKQVLAVWAPGLMTPQDECLGPSSTRKRHVSLHSQAAQGGAGLQGGGVGWWDYCDPSLTDPLIPSSPQPSSI